MSPPLLRPLLLCALVVERPGTQVCTGFRDRSGGVVASGTMSSEGEGSAVATVPTDEAITKKATKSLTKKLGRDPTEKEVAKKVKKLKEKAAAAAGSGTRQPVCVQYKT